MEAISIPQGFKVTPEQFEQLASAEQIARMELTKDGKLIIMSPQSDRSDRHLNDDWRIKDSRGGEAGKKNFNLYIDLGIWNRQRKRWKYIGWGKK